MIEDSFLVSKYFLLDPLQHIDIQFICIYFSALLVIYDSYKRY